MQRLAGISAQGLHLAAERALASVAADERALREAGELDLAQKAESVVAGLAAVARLAGKMPAGGDSGETTEVRTEVREERHDIDG